MTRRVDECLGDGTGVRSLARRSRRGGTSRRRRRRAGWSGRSSRRRPWSAAHADALPARPPSHSSGGRPWPACTLLVLPTNPPASHGTSAFAALGASATSVEEARASVSASSKRRIEPPFVPCPHRRACSLTSGASAPAARALSRFPSPAAGLGVCCRFGVPDAPAHGSSGRWRPARRWAKPLPVNLAVALLRAAEERADAVGAARRRGRRRRSAPFATTWSESPPGWPRPGCPVVTGSRSRSPTGPSSSSPTSRPSPQVRSRSRSTRVHRHLSSQGSLPRSSSCCGWVRSTARAPSSRCGRPTRSPPSTAPTTTSRCCCSPRDGRRAEAGDAHARQPRRQHRAGAGAPGPAGRPDDVGLGVLPLFHVFGLNVVLGLALAAGVTTVARRPTSMPARAPTSCARRGVTVVAGVPTMFARVARAPAPTPPPTRSRRCASRSSGAAALPRGGRDALPRAVRRRGPRGLRPHRGVADRHDDRGRRRAAAGLDRSAAARASTSASSTPTATTCSPATRARSGCGARTCSPATGTIAEATARVLADGWLRTGDVAVADDDGCLSLVDRAKDLVIVSGFNVYPAEVEDGAARRTPTSRRRRSSACRTPRTGEAVVAFVVRGAGRSTSTRRRGARSRARRAWRGTRCRRGRARASTSAEPARQAAPARAAARPSSSAGWRRCGGTVRSRRPHSVRGDRAVATLTRKPGVDHADADRERDRERLVLARRVPWISPPLDSTSVPSAISTFAAASRPCPASSRRRANRTADHDGPADDHDRADPAADRGEHAGKHAEDLLADRDRGPADGLHRRGEHHAGREAGEAARSTRLDPAARRRPGQRGRRCRARATGTLRIAPSR